MQNIKKKKDKLWNPEGSPQINPSWLRLEGHNKYSFNMRVDYILWNTALKLKNEIVFKMSLSDFFYTSFRLKKKKKNTFITFPKSCKKGKLNYRKPL